MCLLVLAWKSHPDYRLIFAGNRDEFHARPTSAAGWWDDTPQVLAGRDLQAGGTWLGLTRAGRFAVVTNFREPAPPPADVSSRGQLVADFLASTARPAGFLRELARIGDRFAGFSLLFGTQDELFYYSNRGDSHGPLEPGVYGLSNHLLDTPWPKVVRAKQAFNTVLKTGPDPERLCDMLLDRTPAAANELPDTGIGPELEHLLSSPCVISERYGTRAATIILIGNDNNAQFIEHSLDSAGAISGSREFNFKLEPIS